jgi:CRISPR/Cas system CSM-associated protein Csm5 (group 7 of RAMP superfamily)
MGHGRENVLGKTTTDGVTRNQCQFSRQLRSMSLPLSSEEIDLMKAARFRQGYSCQQQWQKNLCLRLGFGGGKMVSLAADRRNMG